MANEPQTIQLTEAEFEELKKRVEKDGKKKMIFGAVAGVALAGTVAAGIAYASRDDGPQQGSSPASVTTAAPSAPSAKDVEEYVAAGVANANGQSYPPEPAAAAPTPSPAPSPAPQPAPKQAAKANDWTNVPGGRAPDRESQVNQPPAFERPDEEKPKAAKPELTPEQQAARDAAIQENTQTATDTATGIINGGNAVESVLQGIGRWKSTRPSASLSSDMMEKAEAQKEGELVPTTPAKDMQQMMANVTLPAVDEIKSMNQPAATTVTPTIESVSLASIGATAATQVTAAENFTPPAAPDLTESSQGLTA